MFKFLLREVLTLGLPALVRVLLGKKVDYIGIISEILDELLAQRTDIVSETVALQFVRAEITAMGFKGSKRRKLITEARKQVSAHTDLQ